MILYNLKQDNSAFRITKFDSGLNPEGSYIVSEHGCECPAGVRDSCRHRTMLPLMLDRVNSAWFYCFDDKQWYDPTGEAEPKLVCNYDLLQDRSVVKVVGSSPTEPAKLRRL